MKVILLEDVKKVGKRGDVVDVSVGYARNFLIAKKLGLEASNKALNDIKLKTAADDRRTIEILEAAKHQAEALKDKSVKVTIKAGENGRLFGSVSSKEIATEAKKQLGIEVDKKKLVLKEAIKELGTYEIPLKIHPKVTGSLKVIVEKA
jgi:large subunit ribosomal protein L9